MEPGVRAPSSPPQPGAISQRLPASLDGRSRVGLTASAGLLVIAAGIVVAAIAADAGGRANNPEAVARDYFAALSSGDEAAALNALAPHARDEAARHVAMS